MSTTLAQSSAGTILSVCASLPASELLASYQALSYTPVHEITDVGEYGRKYNKTDHTPIDNRQIFKFRTTYDPGALQLKMAKALTDIGQGILRTALNSDADITVRITAQDGTNEYFRGKVFSYVSNVGNATSLLTASVDFQITSDIF